MSYIENSLELVGYKVRHQKQLAFDLTGFTKVVKSGGEQYDLIRNDGKWEILKNIGNGNNTIFGIASMDDQCLKGYYRYTVAVQAHEDQFKYTSPYNDLFSMHILESDWLVFELESFGKQYGKFWQDNPYKMIDKLGWDFNMDLAIHLDVYAPSYILENDNMEFWMPVKKRE